MRILHVGKFYPPTPGGIESFTAVLAHAQADAGHDVAVLAHAPTGHWRTTSRCDGPIAITETGTWGQLIYAPLSPSFPFQLQQSIQQHRPDLLHIHVPNTSAFAALLVPAARRLPWVVHWHADIPLEGGSRLLRMAYPAYRPWEQALLRHARAIVTTSAAYRDASHALDAWHPKTCVVPLALPPAPAAPLQGDATPLWPVGKCRLLAVGRLSHYKGFDVLIDAVAALPHTALLLIGGGECESALARQIHRLGLHDRVRMTGQAPQALVDQAYAQADIFCLPSLDRAEAFGMVLLEAMRAGLPTVASAIPGSGVGYVIKPGETGLLVAPGNSQALTQALSELCAAPQRRRELGDAGRERWHTHFVPAAITAQIDAIYQQALQPQRDRAAAE